MADDHQRALWRERARRYRERHPGRHATNQARYCQRNPLRRAQSQTLTSAKRSLTRTRQRAEEAYA